MATLHGCARARHRLLVKGAPERAAGCVRHKRGQSTPRTVRPRLLAARIDEWRRAGNGCSPSRRPDGIAPTGWTIVDEGLTFLGLFGLIDPPRKEAIDGRRRMPAGRDRRQDDHRRPRATARAIAAQLGLDDARRRRSPAPRSPRSTTTKLRRRAPDDRCLRARHARAQAAPRRGAAGRTGSSR